MNHGHAARTVEIARPRSAGCATAFTSGLHRRAGSGNGLLPRDALRVADDVGNVIWRVSAARPGPAS